MTNSEIFNIDWQKILSQYRVRGKSNSKKDETDKRTSFDSDYDRIIFSSAFRRLQDKAQVFPLENGDFVRTRLTHSLEVAAIAESIGTSIGHFLMDEDKTFEQNDINKLKKVLACAGLLHDIGNTPFGHFGERAIQDYFTNFFKYYEETDEANVPNKDKFQKLRKKISNLQCSNKKDFEYYDGNAQALRNICVLQNMQSNGGLNLTYGTLSAFIKYPRSSDEGNKKSEKISCKKYGYLQSEKDIFNKIVKNTGLINKDGIIFRNPIVYILEAADDIAYSASDIEDGIKKGLLTIDYLKKEIIKVFLNKYKLKKEEKFINELINGVKIDDKTFNLIKTNGTMRELSLYLKLDYREKSIMKAIYDNIETGDPNDQYIRAQMLRVSIQGYMIACVVDEFKQNYESIKKGTYEKELLNESNAGSLRKVLKDITVKKIFNSKDILKNELAGYKVITRLLELFINAVVIEKDDDKGRRLYNLISDNYRNMYEKKADKTIYDEIQLVVDFISGMTDYYALDLYKHLQGIII